MKILGQQYDPLIPLVIGTQTAATNAFTGVLPLDELKHGQSIRFWLPYAGTSSGNTLELTLRDGSTTGAIQIYYKGTTKLTTHYSAGSLILMTYLENANVNGTSYTGWWCGQDYNSNTTTTTNSTNTSVKIFLIGAKAQGSSQTTFSHDTVYVGTDGHVYSNKSQVVNVSDTQALTNKTYNGYTLGAACAKGVDTTVKDGSSNLVTGDAVHTALRPYCSMIPYGTAIAADSDLNTTDFLKVGNYYCSSNANAKTLSNSPTTSAFMMQVFSPLSTTIDNETTGTWVYRLRKLQVYTGDEYIQYCSAGATAGTWTYGAWVKTARTSDLSSYALASHTHGLHLQIAENLDGGYDLTLADTDSDMGNTVTIPSAITGGTALTYAVLYNSSTGTTGTVTLSETAANFSMIEIIVGYADIYGANSVKVYSPNGKTTDIAVGVAGTNQVQVGRTRCKISGTSITQSYNATTAYKSSAFTNQTNAIYIKTVIGYR